MKFFIGFMFSITALNAFSQIDDREVDIFVIKRVTEEFLLQNGKMDQYRVELHAILQTCPNYFVIGVPDSLVTGSCKEDHYYSDCILALCGVSLFFHSPEYVFSLEKFDHQSDNTYLLKFNLLKSPTDPNKFERVKTLNQYTIIAARTNESEVIVKSISKK